MKPLSKIVKQQKIAHISNQKSKNETKNYYWFNLTKLIKQYNRKANIKVYNIVFYERSKCLTQRNS